MPGNWGLVDLETPKEAYTKVDYVNGKTWELVFSDEFNVDGRTFYPGDDPYWEAVDLHYWQTNNLEWYDPAAITTRDGSLEVTLSKKKTHDMDFQGGMMSTWNKFCFTSGYIESEHRRADHMQSELIPHSICAAARGAYYSWVLARCMAHGQPWSSRLRSDDGRPPAVYVRPVM